MDQTLKFKTTNQQEQSLQEEIENFEKHLRNPRVGTATLNKIGCSGLIYSDFNPLPVIPPPSTNQTNNATESDTFSTAIFSNVTKWSENIDNFLLPGASDSCRALINSFTDEIFQITIKINTTRDEGRYLIAGIGDASGNNYGGILALKAISSVAPQASWYSRISGARWTQLTQNPQLLAQIFKEASVIQKNSLYYCSSVSPALEGGDSDGMLCPQDRSYSPDVFRFTMWLPEFNQQGFPRLQPGQQISLWNGVVDFASQSYIQYANITDTLRKDFAK